MYLDRSETPSMRHWTAHHLVAPATQLTVDPLGQPAVSGAQPQWPHTWDMAVRTMRMAPRGQRAGWPGAEHLLAEARVAQAQQPAGNTKDCGVCALMSAVGTLLRVPRPGNLLSALDRRWVAAVVLNRDMGPIARLLSLGELPPAVLDALPAPRTPLDVADVQHSVGLPGRACNMPCCVWRRRRMGGCPCWRQCPCSTCRTRCSSSGCMPPSRGKKAPSGG